MRDEAGAVFHHLRRAERAGSERTASGTCAFAADAQDVGTGARCRAAASGFQGRTGLTGYGRRLGFVQDVCADLETGRITSIIVPGGTNKLMSLFSSNNDIVIPWNKIKCIGDDLILVELDRTM